MIVRLALCVVLAGLTACASQSGPANPGTYTLGRGLVNYDVMRRAKEQCAADGGTVRPKDEGGDTAQMSNYQCVIPAGGKSQ